MNKRELWEKRRRTLKMARTYLRKSSDWMHAVRPEDELPADPVPPRHVYDESTPKCEVCGTTEDLHACPVMTGDKFGEPTKHPVCGACIRAWHEGGEATREGILHYRGITPGVDTG